MGNGTEATQWTAQWAVDDCHQRRSGTIGGNTRWKAAAITMDSSSVIAMDGGSGDGQWWCNGRQDNKAFAMGIGMAVVRGTAQWVADTDEGTKMGAMLGFLLVAEL